MNAHRTAAPLARPAVDLDETRRRFLLAREQLASHGSVSSVRELGRWSTAADAPRRACC
jgi:hypothetical protein